MGRTRIGRWSLPLALLVLTALGCGGPAEGPEVAPLPGDWRAFEGTWSATGHRQTLRLGPGRKAAIFHLTGSLLLVGERRLGQGFQSQVIGFTDNTKGNGGWCVWTDSRGDQIYSELRGEPVGTGRRIVGTILGGSGRYAGITGEYGFEWQFVVGGEDGEDGDFQGRAVGLRGRFRRVARPSSPAGENPGAPPGGGPRS